MKKFSVIFPGYGLYNIEFLKKFIKKYSIIQQTFKEASDIVNYNIENYFFKKKNNFTFYNKNIYLLTFISSVAIYRLLEKEINIQPNIISGHSIGQYSALVCNKNILFKEAIKIIKIRNKIMLKAVQNIRILTLVIIGLNYNIIKKICSLISTKKKIFISIINSKKQIVITGNYSEVYTAGLIFKKKFYAKIIRLPMLIASHCLLMKNYQKEFSYYLKKIKIFTGKNPIISNHNAKIMFSKKKIYSSLTKQIYKKVQWYKSIKKIISMGIDIFIEVGPGEILTNLNKENKNISSYSTNSYKKLLLVMDIIKKL
ncbi:Malonyl CoA-acyl carrier protein transacylase [Buchnera aphidicola (Cinara piceae)]|uniref:Malonyl CoA-acyl carrier protein transacylase n=1 Tax=Buchnera aphidicola (Cinara piceae) TaxID=1660043 RepID=A0A803FU08_9GAMM|nr:ACP S-malonyltransferase [Buchnera aphidicola]VFP88398.1 Malonyl CoA-acyl carrier protein transacylase [Buchnera aphidicola (Cinara piceae)]